MASRKDQKEAARQTRIAQEQAAAAQAAQRRRLGIIAGVVVVAVIVAVVAVVVSSGGSSTPGIQTGTTASATYQTVASDLNGIPQSGTVLGKSDAPVTIEYFGDLECPICADFTKGEDGSGLPQLISGPVKAGKVKLDYESFETASAAVNNDRFVPQQVAAYAAGKQNLFWDYAELFYREQGSEDSRYVTESYLTNLAKQIPKLNLSTWEADRKDSALKAQVTAGEKLASSDGLSGTPTLVAIGPKSEEMVPAASGIPTYSEITAAIKAVS